MKPDKSIERLSEDFDPDRRCPVLLEAGAVDSFLKWLNDNITYLDMLERDVWRIGILRQHLEMRDDWNTLEANLVAANVRVLDNTLTQHDDTLVSEILQAYFSGVGIYRKAAQLLAYGRKKAEAGDDVQIISRLRVFRLVPNVQAFSIPGADYKGTDEEAYYLRLLDTLNIHKTVQDVAYSRVLSHNYADAVAQTTQWFIDEIRGVGKQHQMGFANNTNDQPMVDQALHNEEYDGVTGKKKDVSPLIQVNDLSHPSDKSEQKGYRDLMCGVVNAVRNPSSHSPIDKEFIQSRFGDRRTALKFLCLLSLLFEKLDKRVAPR